MDVRVAICSCNLFECLLLDSFAEPFSHFRFIQIGFLTTGVLQFEVNSGVVDKKFEYSYDNRQDNRNIHTLQKLSTNASITMKFPDGSYYKEFQSFVDYYGDTSYGDKWISAARWKRNTDFSSKYVPLFSLGSRIHVQLCI